MGIVSSKAQGVQGTSAIIYGLPGTGKTTIAAKIPGNTLLIALDPGFSVLEKEEKEVDVFAIKPDMSDLAEAMEEAKGAKYQNVGFDSLTEFEQLLMNFYSNKSKTEMMQQGDYLKCYQKLFQYAQLLRNIQFENKNVFVTALEVDAVMKQSDNSMKSLTIPYLKAKQYQIIKQIMGYFDIIGRTTWGKTEETQGKVFINMRASEQYPLKDRKWNRAYCTPEDLFNNNKGEK